MINKNYKKWVGFLVLLFGGLQGFSQTETALYSCLDNQNEFQKEIKIKQTQFDYLQKRISSDVSKLIGSYQISNQNGVLSFENLASVISVATELNKWDDEYDQFLGATIEELVSHAWSQQLCTFRYTESVYKELVTEYLEDTKFYSADEYASTVLANSLHFQSAFIAVSQQESNWLQQEVTYPGDNSPAMNQLIDNEYYWGVLNPNWDIKLRNPEIELLRRVDQAELSGKKEKPTLKEVLTLIFDTFDNIKEVMNWLVKDILSDCAGTTKAEIKNTELIPSSLSTVTERKVSYHVFQRGVGIDLVNTSTKIFGKVRLYKKKRNGWKRDKSVVTGISYCLKEWEACDNNPFPADGSIYNQGANHLYKKAVLRQVHPHPLQIVNSSSEFLTFQLFYNRYQFLSIFALGNHAECN